MSKETRPKGEGDDLLTPELAKTELAPSKDAATRTGPRVAGPTAPTGPPGPRVVGRFRIDAQLGSGGMGDVFRAYDPVLDRAVALKVLRTERSADDQQRMRRVVREARAAAALTHPNTVTIFEVGEADREVFIAMELLEGEDLRAVMDRGEASVAEKLRWLLEAARALGAAHERGLVHRDVKPENMFVCKGGALKLLDFGIAKRDDDEGAPLDAAVDMGPSSLRTTEGRRIGTPRYMAPEQHAGDATDPRTDEYAWGLVAFELLCGAHVVADLRTKTTDGGEATPDSALSAQRLDMLRAKAPEVSETVLRTIGRALEPRKEDRFPSMAPIIAAIEEKAAAKTDDKKQDEAPQPPRSHMRLWVVLPAIATAVVAGLFALRAATHLTTRAGAGAGDAAVARACGIASSRTLTVGPDVLAARSGREGRLHLALRGALDREPANIRCSQRRRRGDVRQQRRRHRDDTRGHSVRGLAERCRGLPAGPPRGHPSHHHGGRRGFVSVRRRPGRPCRRGIPLSRRAALRVPRRGPRSDRRRPDRRAHHVDARGRVRARRRAGGVLGRRRRRQDSPLLLRVRPRIDRKTGIFDAEGRDRRAPRAMGSRDRAAP